MSGQGLSIMVNSKFRSLLLETRLEARESQLQQATAATGLGFWTWEPASGELHWSARCLALLDIPADSPATLDSLLGAVSAEDLPRVRRSLALAMQTRSEFELEFQIAAASLKRVHCTARPHASSLDRNGHAYSGVLRELPAAAAHPTNLASRVGSLAFRMESLRELERATLINRMKSELAQHLVAVRGRIARLLEDQTVSSAVRSELTQLAEDAEASADSVRAAIFEMQPPGVAELGFAGALERYATEQAAAAGIRLTLALPSAALPLGAPTLESLYVVARTGIDNVVRHARARHFKVAVTVDADQVALSISDDGIGIQDADLMKDGAFSLFAASERLANSGGELRVNGAANRGTTLEASLPLRHKARPIRHNIKPLQVA
jgi:signal transduction histidine kinase